jgi:hypothetical protein
MVDSPRQWSAFRSRPHLNGWCYLLIGSQQGRTCEIGTAVYTPSHTDKPAPANIFNILNAGDYTQYNYNGANEQFNPNYLQMRNQQPARALQVTVVYRF